MATLKLTLVVVVAGYVGLVALMYAAQRSLMYFPDPQRVPPRQAGLPQASEVALVSDDGTRLIAWHVPPRGARPVIIYLHGNGGALRHRVPRFAALIEGGYGLLALSYRGYGGSSGSPSERGLIADAKTAYDFVVARHAGTPVLWGESLGSGVAVALAAELAVTALVLEAPFTSTADLAFASYPFIPVRLLMKDQFRSDERIGQVKAPLLVLHGARDRVVPISYGERLFALAPEPKKFIGFPAGEHEDLGFHGAVRAALDFLDGVVNANPK
jgi:fermentation-respiration switch protein FrsA (DUF1100 family)